MSKEYTYDIDKYTIGVDTNGEDGIGLTIAIIKNGEINFLGNCYGENARCLDLLIKENQELKLELSGYRQAILNNKEMLGLKEQNEELKKQLENKYEKVGTLTSELLYEENTKLINQQKEFINYLEDEIQNKREKSTTLTAFIRNVVPLQQSLQKYKEIIGDINDKK